MAVALPQSPVVQCVPIEEGLDPGQALLEVVATIDGALELGAPLIDVTCIAKWEFLGNILEQRRTKLSVAFRFGMPAPSGGGLGDCTPLRVRKTCEEALQVLGLDTIDFFYQDRPDTATPIDQTMAELKALVQEGKVRSIGIAADSAATVVRAHIVQPLAAVSLEWSLWRPRALDDVVSAIRDRGIAILAKKPCGAGLMDVRRVEREFISDKMKTLLEDQSHLFLEKLRKLVDEPSCDLVDSLRKVVSEEADRCSESVQEKLAVQSHELTAKIEVLATGPNEGMVKFLTEIVQDQQSHFLGKFNAVMCRQRWKIIEKVGVLKDACGGQSIGSLKNMLRKQKCKAVETLARVRARQEEVLLLKAEGYMLGQTENFLAALKGFLTCQKTELVLLITDTRSKMNSAILERIRYTCAEHNTRIAAKVLVVKDKQSVLVTRTARKMIGGQDFPKSGLQTLEETLQSQKEDLVQKAKLFSTMGRGWVLSVVKRLIDQHVAEIMQQIDSAVDGKARNLQSRVLQGMGEHGNEAMMSSETRTLLVDISLAVSERVREVASSRGCPPRSVALAWLSHQGNDVLPILSGGKDENLEQDILACSMQLTEQELATLCVGPGDDRDGWKLEPSSDDDLPIW